MQLVTSCYGAQLRSTPPPPASPRPSRCVPAWQERSCGRDLPARPVWPGPHAERSCVVSAVFSSAFPLLLVDVPRSEVIAVRMEGIQAVARARRGGWQWEGLLHALDAGGRRRQAAAVQPYLRLSGHGWQQACQLWGCTLADCTQPNQRHAIPYPTSSACCAANDMQPYLRNLRAWDSCQGCEGERAPAAV